MSQDKRQRAVESYRRARKQADRVLDRTSLKPVRDSYETESGRLVSGLGRLFHGQTRSLVDSSVIGRALGWLASRFSSLSDSVGRVLAKTTRLTFTEGFRSSADTLHYVRGAASPMNDNLLLRVMTGHLTTLEQMRRQSAEALAGTSKERVSEALRLLVVEPEIRVSDLVTRVGEVLDEEAWRVDRLVRTETSYAYNLAQAEAIAAVSHTPEFRQLYNRWTERVDDLSGRALDRRVAIDSMVLHAQIARPGRFFRMPQDPRAPSQMIGETWLHPPNRPNDRAVLTPWMGDWGVPGWLLQGNTRKYL